MTMYEKIRICISTYLKYFIDLITINLVMISFPMIQNHFHSVGSFTDGVESGKKTNSPDDQGCSFT